LRDRRAGRPRLVTGKVSRDSPGSSDRTVIGQGAYDVKRILIVLSEYGYWGEELIGPLEEFDKAGYQVDFMTPTGKRPVAITVSMDPEYVDPPLGRSVTTQEVADKVKEIDKSPRLDNPLNLQEIMPERPYHSEDDFLRKMEAYHKEADKDAQDFVNKYDAILIVGGSGPIVDLVNNQRLHDLILAFYRAGEPIGAECYGVTCLAFARNWEDRKSIIAGKHVTGHCIEYDYKYGTGFMGTNFVMGPPPYPLEWILRDATQPGGAYHGNYGHETSVIVDYPFITGRSTPDSYLTGQKMVEVLEKGLTRYGW
jgi:putative intracellular protease/amidase